MSPQSTGERIFLVERYMPGIADDRIVPAVGLVISRQARPFGRLTTTLRQ